MAKYFTADGFAAPVPKASVLGAAWAKPKPAATSPRYWKCHAAACGYRWNWESRAACFGCGTKQSAASKKTGTAPSGAMASDDGWTIVYKGKPIRVLPPGDTRPPDAAQPLVAAPSDKAADKAPAATKTEVEKALVAPGGVGGLGPRQPRHGGVR